jgi:hypothetical protein
MFPFSALLLVRLLRFSFVNIEFLKRKKLILSQAKRASHFVKIIVACPHHLPKLPESTQRKQAIPNKGSLFYSHCDLTTIVVMKVVDNNYAVKVRLQSSLECWKKVLFYCGNKHKMS